MGIPKKKTRLSVNNKNRLSSNSKSVKRTTIKMENGSNLKIKGATKVDYMGISFKSKLEFFMYKLLLDNNLNPQYESKSFDIQNSVDLNFNSFENCKNKGYIQVSNKLRKASYKPDFVVETDSHYYIIETKGFKTDIFQLRFKVFKFRLHLDRFQLTKKIVELHVPSTQKDCLEVLKRILNHINEYEEYITGKRGI